MTSAVLSRERLRRIKNPWALHRALWLSTARANQLPPPGTDWDMWMNRSGRGNGKTRSGSEEASEQARLGGEGWRGLLVGRTYRDVRDVMVEGPAGLLSVIPESMVKNWNRSLGELTLMNGARFECFGAEDVDIIRGHEYHWAWLDELAAYTYAEDMLDAVRFTLRAGVHPRLIITTTPRPTKLIQALEVDPTVAVTEGTMFDNDHLSSIARAALLKKYGGTTLGEQELYGKIIADVAGALWRMALIDSGRFKMAERPDTISRIVIGVDPDGGGPDDCGIVATGRTYIPEPEGYVERDDYVYDPDQYLVLADRSISTNSPAKWAAAAVQCYVDYDADLLVAERNYGGAMVGATIKTAAKAMGVECNFKLVTATKGKAVRAEPVSALYQQQRVHHMGGLAELESQMTTWVPGMKSPDRMDAMVWGMTELMANGDWGLS